MNFQFDTILERDMDFVFMDAIAKYPEVQKIFCDPVGIKEAKVVSVRHSVSDPQHGETDILVELSANGKSCWFLIENKIDAPAQPDQASRYEKRASKAMKQQAADNCYIFVVAPNSYLESNAEAAKYPNRISYENILAVLETIDEFKATAIRAAIEKKKNGYTPVIDEAVTDFCNKYYSYRREYYPQLHLREVPGSKGPTASWIDFTTENSFKKLVIVHKSDRGYVDLQLPGLGGHEERVKELLRYMLPNDISVENATGSVAIRIIVPTMDFHKPFEDYIQELPEVFDAVERLSNFAKDLRYNDLRNDILGDK